MFDIIIPVFKTPMHLLKQCLDSVAKQTFKDYTIWVCDGTPNEWKRYDEMLEVFNSYENLEYVRQSGKGVSQARNQIIKMGNNPYVAFLDSDDSWDIEYLETMKRAIEKPLHDTTAIWFSEIKSFTSHYELFDLATVGIQGEVGLVVEREKLLQSYQTLNFIPPKYHLHFHHTSPLWFTGAIFKREALESTNLFDESLTLAEDTVLLLDVLNNGFSSCHVPFVGAFRHSHDGQLSVIYAGDKEHIESVEKYDYRLQELIDDEDLREDVKENILAHWRGGKNRGVSILGCVTKYYLIDKECYEIETL